MPKASIWNVSLPSSDQAHVLLGQMSLPPTAGFTQPAVVYSLGAPLGEETILLSKWVVVLVIAKCHSGPNSSWSGGRGGIQRNNPEIITHFPLQLVTIQKAGGCFEDQIHIISIPGRIKSLIILMPIIHKGNFTKEYEIFFLFIYLFSFYLKVKETQIDLSSASSLVDAPKQLGLDQIELGTWNLIWVSYVIGRNPGTSAITCCLPGCTVAGWTKREGAGIRTRHFV